MKKLVVLFAISAIVLPACSQSGNQKTNVTTKHVGGNCEGCEAIFESPVAFKDLANTATLPDYDEPGQKMTISGTVFMRDGKTPAADVVIYVYHTDQTGKYTPGEQASGWEKRHGRLRGWLKTDKKGFYQFHTLKPAPYPGTNIPAHVHITVKEPDKNEYYIDEYLFEDDPFLTASERKRQEGRGGSGIIKLHLQSNKMATATRNITLGKNIPSYAD